MPDSSLRYINIHIMSNALHYGQALFEGVKAFHCADGKVRIFRDDRNEKRMNEGAERLVMQPVHSKKKSKSDFSDDSIPIVSSSDSGLELLVYTRIFST